jgi:hypothetical protein
VRPQAGLKNWIDTGSLPALRVGRRVQVRRSDFEELLERGYKRPAGASEAQRFWEGDWLPQVEVPDS